MRKKNLYLFFFAVLITTLCRFYQVNRKFCHIPLYLLGVGASPLPTYFWTKARPTAGARALAGSSIILRSEFTSAYPPHPRQSPFKPTVVSRKWSHTHDWRNGIGCTPCFSCLVTSLLDTLVSNNPPTFKTNKLSSLMSRIHASH